MQSKNYVLVTGGAGYIGVVLVQRLLRNGFNVRVLDALHFGKESLKPVMGKVDIVKDDIRNISANVFDDVKSVIHLAGLSNDPTAEVNPKLTILINTQATLDLAKKAKHKGVEKFIFGSSSSIYDLGVSKGEKVKNESSEVNPRSIYAISKYRAEDGLLKLADNNFCVTIFRKGNVFGFSPRMRYDLIVNSMIKDVLDKNEIRIFNEGLQWRPLIFIEDVADAYIKAIISNSKQTNKQIFNIALKNFQVKEIAEVIKGVLEKELKTRIKLKQEAVSMIDKSYSVSTTKSKKILNFTPKVSLESGIIEILKSIKNSKYTDFDNSIYYNILHTLPFLKKE